MKRFGQWLYVRQILGRKCESGHFCACTIKYFRNCEKFHSASRHFLATARLSYTFISDCFFPTLTILFSYIGYLHIKLH